MSIAFDHKVFFDSVRTSLFGGSMSQSQVAGMEAILSGWEAKRGTDDVRWLAYFLATTYHETAQAMVPVEEYGQGKGKPYGEPNENGDVFYGRGFVQLTWEDNYRRADEEFGWTEEKSCRLHPDIQLQVVESGMTGYRGMVLGWFRGDTLGDYFSDKKDDPFHARNIINGDMNVVPSWSNGMSIGKLVEQYHDKFLDALELATVRKPAPEPEPEVVIDITADIGVKVTVLVNGEKA